MKLGLVSVLILIFAKLAATSFLQATSVILSVQSQTEPTTSSQPQRGSAIPLSQPQISKSQTERSTTSSQPQRGSATLLSQSQTERPPPPSQSQAGNSTNSDQNRVSPQSEVRLNGPLAMPLYPPSKLRVDFVSEGVRLEWAAIPLERVKGYVVYRWDSGQWHRSGFVTKPPFIFKVRDENLDTKFSVATLDKSGLESKKSTPIKMPGFIESPPNSPIPK
jgi:hypothetical protein